MVLGGLEIWVWGLILSVGFVLSSYFIEDKEKRGIFYEIYDKVYTRRINEIYPIYNARFINIIKNNNLEYLGECIFRINNLFHIGFIISTIYCINLYQIEKNFIKFSFNLAHILLFINITFLITHVLFKFLFKKLTYKVNELELNDICESIVEDVFRVPTIINRSKDEMEIKKLELYFKNYDKDNYFDNKTQMMKKETLIGFKLDYLNDVMRVLKLLIYSFTSLLIGVFVSFMYSSILIYGYELYTNNFKIKEPLVVSAAVLVLVLAFNKFIIIVYELYKSLLSKIHSNIILIIKRKLYLYDLLEIDKNITFTKSNFISELKFNENLDYRTIVKLSDDDLSLINLKIKLLNILKNMEDQYVSRFKFLFYNFK